MPIPGMRGNLNLGCIAGYDEDLACGEKVVGGDSCWAPDENLLAVRLGGTPQNRGEPPAAAVDSRLRAAGSEPVGGQDAPCPRGKPMASGWPADEYGEHDGNHGDSEQYGSVRADGLDQHQGGDQRSCKQRQLVAPTPNEKDHVGTSGVNDCLLQRFQQMLSVDAPLHDAPPGGAVTQSRRTMPYPTHGRHGSAEVSPLPPHAPHTEIKSHRGSR
jgi:hypothetical protein